MKYYIGIDLGTTNSAICSYDGKDVRVWKSPEQTDVTPSAIYVGKRGNKYYGMRAYNTAPSDPSNSATLFKRFIGTNTKIRIDNLGTELTPEECSAEILKVLYGYLPEEIRNSNDAATVITVPAAFNQMKKDATLQAARIAGIGNVALMQEPVAAIMSIMKTAKQNGIFLVYDLGGGTFDISIAQNINGKVSLLAHGGIEMCGGRDIDRAIFNNIVLPWIFKNFSVTEDFVVNAKYSKFYRLALWATEQAKIELSANDDSVIRLEEERATTEDENGKEMYLEIPISRNMIDDIIEGIVNETIEATRDTIKKNGLSTSDIETVVFVGGPTNYKPLRDRVSSELSLKASIDINPMTAVAEGASIFAESIDWSSNNHERKSANAIQVASGDISFKYTARVSSPKAKVMCVLKNPISGATIEFVSSDTGWTSGRLPLSANAISELPLAKSGDNHFSVSVFDELGRKIQLEDNTITITKTIASIASIPASHSIGIEVLDNTNGKSSLEFLVHEGDPLPHKGSVSFKAGQTVSAGSEMAINIKLWEGEILDPISDNRFVGVLKVRGRDLDSGVIPVGTEIICDYLISDSGNVMLEVSIPSASIVLNNKNFYSREEGQVDLSDIEGVSEDGRTLLNRLQSIKETVNDERIEMAWEKANHVASLDSSKNVGPEDVQKALNELLEIKKLLYKTRMDRLPEIRRAELKDARGFYSDVTEKIADEEAKKTFGRLFAEAERAIGRSNSDFESIIEAIKSATFRLLVQEDWFVVEMYKSRTSNPRNYSDRAEFERLKTQGDSAMAAGNIAQLRKVMDQLTKIRIYKESADDMFGLANILRG